MGKDGSFNFFSAKPGSFTRGAGLWVLLMVTLIATVWYTAVICLWENYFLWGVKSRYYFTVRILRLWESLIQRRQKKRKMKQDKERDPTIWKEWESSLAGRAGSRM